VLRKQLDPQLSSRIDAEIDKDFTHASGDELYDRVRAERH
jgi:protein required for attachment to host cells